MSFELAISTKRDPLDGRPTPNPASACHTTVTLNGIFDEAAARAVLGTIEELVGEEATSILIEMQAIAGVTDFEHFAAELMRLRAAGKHVQVAVRDPALHARMSSLDDARDWLVVYSEVPVDGARRGIHVDGVAWARPDV
jgi:hypothetical protein